MRLTAKCLNCPDGWLVLDTSDGDEAKAVCDTCGIIIEKFDVTLLHPVPTFGHD
jgi:hypothetical protein